MLSPALAPNTACSLPHLSHLLRTMVRAGQLTVVDPHERSHQFGEVSRLSSPGCNGGSVTSTPQPSAG